MYRLFALSVIFVQTIPSGFIVCRRGDQDDLLEQQAGEFAVTGLDESGYERFEIETRTAPPRRRQPYPFNPRPRKLGLARVLLSEVFHYGFQLRRKEYQRVLLSRPCIYGVFSGRFGGFHPINERCTGCMRCVQEFPSICRVDRNLEFYKFADSYWAPEDPATASATPVSIISYEASTGKIPIRGMGYKGSFAGPGWDSIWTDMSEIVRPTRDGVYGREYISTLVDLGRKQKFLEFRGREPTQVSRTVQTSLPILFDYLPPNISSQYVTQSIARASKRVGTLFIASPEQASVFLSNYERQMVPLISSSRINECHDVIRRAPAVEVSGFDPDALERIRKTNGRTPVWVRVPFTTNSDRDVVEIAKQGVDAIHLFADYHGGGWDQENAGFVKDLIRSVHRALLREHLRDEVTIIASGGITLAEHVPKAIICGADLIALDTTVLVALQAEFIGECKSAEEARIRPEKFDVAWGEQRLVNLLASWYDQLIEILSAMGMRDVRRLRGDIGRAMFNEDLEREAFGGSINRA